MSCACAGEIVCLECRAEIARRMAGEGERGWTWSVAGIHALWAATDAKRAAQAEAEGFGWSPP